MKMTFRWYGEGRDSISLKYIKQIPGCSGLMGLLDAKAAGEVWEEQEIKLGLSTRDKYIENYKICIRNLAKYGVKVIVYNFMPVLDWLRTDLARINPEDGSTSLYFDEKDLGAMTPVEIVKKTAASSNGFSLPGWEPERLADLEKVMDQYKGIDNEKLLENFKYFLDAIIPVCEEVGVKMSCHPDDPGWPIFGLPRLAHDQAGFDKIIALHDSPCNTVCLCTGSLGSNVHNNIPAMIRHFGKMHRIGCLHVRNVKHLGSDRKFREASHLSSTGDLDMYEIMKAIYETCPDTYIRPDHGRMIWDEIGRPGYGLYDRALGLAYLNGLWEAIVKGNKNNHE